MTDRAEFSVVEFYNDDNVTSAAQQLGIGRSALSNVLNGNAALSPELALKIEREFGLDARKLLTDQLVEGLDALRGKR